MTGVTRYHVAAVVPAVVAVVCVVVAWYILWRPEVSVRVPSLPVSPGARAVPRARALPAAPVSVPEPGPVCASVFSSRSTSVTSAPPRALSPALQTPVDARRSFWSGSAPPPSRSPFRVNTPDEQCGLARHTRTWKLNFSSSCRDTSVWPSTSEWRVDLHTPMRNVSTVSLRSVGLSPSEYTVDVWNNGVDLSFGGNVYSVEVPPGVYTTGSSLASAVQTAILATDAALAGFTVTYAASTDRVTISESSPAEFTLLWASGGSANTSMWATLGWLREDTVSVLVGGSHDAVSPGRIDLNGVLAVDVFADELSNSLDGPIGRVVMNRSVVGDPVFRETPQEDSHRFWPIARLQFLTFRFMVQYGRVNADGSVVCAYRPYQFHGRANTLRLDVGETSYVNPMELDVQLDPGT